MGPLAKLQLDADFLARLNRITIDHGGRLGGEPRVRSLGRRLLALASCFVPNVYPAAGRRPHGSEMCPSSELGGGGGGDTAETALPAPNLNKKYLPHLVLVLFLVDLGVSLRPYYWHHVYDCHNYHYQQLQQLALAESPAPQDQHQHPSHQQQQHQHLSSQQQQQQQQQHLSSSQQPRLHDYTRFFGGDLALTNASLRARLEWARGELRSVGAPWYRTADTYPFAVECTYAYLLVMSLVMYLWPRVFFFTPGNPLRSHLINLLSEPRSELASANAQLVAQINQLLESNHNYLAKRLRVNLGLAAAGAGAASSLELAAGWPPASLCLDLTAAAAPLVAHSLQPPMPGAGHEVDHEVDHGDHHHQQCGRRPSAGGHQRLLADYCCAYESLRCAALRGHLRLVTRGARETDRLVRLYVAVNLGSYAIILAIYGAVCYIVAGFDFDYAPMDVAVNLAILANTVIVTVVGVFYYSNLVVIIRDQICQAMHLDARMRRYLAQTADDGGGRQLKTTGDPDLELELELELDSDPDLDRELLRYRRNGELLTLLVSYKLLVGQVRANRQLLSFVSQLALCVTFGMPVVVLVYGSYVKTDIKWLLLLMSLAHLTICNTGVLPICNLQKACIALQRTLASLVCRLTNGEAGGRPGGHVSKSRRSLSAAPAPNGYYFEHTIWALRQELLHQSRLIEEFEPHPLGMSFQYGSLLKYNFWISLVMLSSFFETDAGGGGGDFSGAHQLEQQQQQHHQSTKLLTNLISDPLGIRRVEAIL